ncbi:MAG: methyl-accepting chemotaxis protein [Leptospiraceae bacterium]|nr:methyl-accepting chemotaxis protein [Leptospiraceae bacterium]
MEDIIKKEIRSLNLRMEIVNYIGGVPLAVFFLVLSQKMYYEKFYYIAISFLAAITITLIIFPFSRAKIFWMLFQPVIDSKTESEQSESKEKLLKFPFYCGILVISQWILGAITTSTVYYSFVPVSLYGIITFVLLLVFLSPVVYMIHSTQADLFLSKILTLPEIRDIPMNTKNIQAITIFQRISIASFSILFLPIGYLVCLYFFGSLSDTNDPFRDYLVALIGIQSLSLSFICSNLLSKILSKNTENVKEALSELKNGNLSYKMALVDSEELGFVLALHFNELRDRIFQVVTHLKTTSNKLNALSINLEDNSSHVATEAENQSSFSEELSASMLEFQSAIKQTEDNTEVQKGLTEVCASALVDLEKEMQSSLTQASKSAELSLQANKFAEVGAGLGLSTKNAISEIQIESKAILDYAQLISEISDQVGLLSLNASIESSRAGESGRGFQVVAREISKLGENTNENSQMISKKLKVLSQKIKSGYQQIQEVSDQFREIQTASIKSDESIKHIAENLKRQSKLQSTVNVFISQLKDQAQSIRNSTKEQKLTIEESTYGLEKLASSSEQLAVSARNLKNVSMELKEDAAILLKQIEFFKV